MHYSGLLLCFARKPGRWRARRSKQDDLSHQSEVLRTIVDCAADAILTISTDGTIRTANAATARMFGYTIAELIGQNVSMLMPPPYAQEHNGYLKRYLLTHEPRVIGIGRNVRAKAKDGSIFPVHLSLSEGRTSTDHFFTGFLRDIRSMEAAQAATEQEKLLLEGVFASSVDAILVIDPKGIVQHVNQSTLRMFGYSEAELVGNNVSMLMPQPHRKQHDSYLKRYLQTGEKRREGARALGQLNETGTLEPGKWCDLAIWDIERPAELVYRVGSLGLAGRLQASEKMAPFSRSTWPWAKSIWPTRACSLGF